MTRLVFPPNPSVGDVLSRPGCADLEWNGEAWGVKCPPAAGVEIVPNHGRLIVHPTDARQIIYVSYPTDDDNKIKINGEIRQFSWPNLSIGFAMGENVLHYIYMYVSGQGVHGTALFASTTGHTTDNTPGNVGVQIMQGDSRYTLVGMIYVTTVPSQVYTGVLDTPEARHVASWFNREDASLYRNYLGTPTWPSTPGFLALAAVPLSLLCWSDEVVAVNAIPGAAVPSDAAEGRFWIGANANAATVFGGIEQIYARRPAGLFSAALHAFDTLPEGRNTFGGVTHTISGDPIRTAFAIAAKTRI